MTSIPLTPCFIILLCFCIVRCTTAATVQLDWKVQYANVTRLCNTKSLISINGQFPGPTVYVREGDNVEVKVTNLVPHNITIHWHGVRQFLTAWADGPAYITQCPIKTGNSYVHRFQVIDQRGTLFYHAHISWIRATVHGAFIILPRLTAKFPFSSPVVADFPIILGEWYNANVEDVIAAVLASGGAPTDSDAITINGQPGDLYACSKGETTTFNVTSGQTYLLRVINAALNFQLYFGITGHSLTVVEADAEYLKPYNTPYIVVAPGQTTSVLLTTNQKSGQYYMVANVSSLGFSGLAPLPSNPTTAILNYVNSNSIVKLGGLPTFPAFDDATSVEAFFGSLRSQSFSRGFYYTKVPQKVTHKLFLTVGFSTQPCPTTSCIGASGGALSASINNITFVHPSISILQAYFNQINNVYQTNFPNHPLIQFNYTAPYVGGSQQSMLGTKVKVLGFNENVQIVFQDTSLHFFESHPIHLHGQNFFIVGSGFGNYNASIDPKSFNLVDPPLRNTVAVPSGGWAVIRFRTTNPGVWYMHCHIDLHNSWGMAMAFIVKNGNGPKQTLSPPPADLPPC